jgi:3-methyl-2-oxobutanoate hydroxymethyltransferase
VFEAIPASVAQLAMERIEIPVIGIGAGSATDGQVLVWHDLLGLYAGHAPRFVKQYASLAPEITEALGRFVGDVRSGAFPEAQHTYSMPDEELALFQKA